MKISMGERSLVCQCRFDEYLAIHMANSSFYKVIGIKKSDYCNKITVARNIDDKLLKRLNNITFSMTLTIEIIFIKIQDKEDIGERRIVGVVSNLISLAERESPA
jgi:hypothetical protein